MEVDTHHAFTAACRPGISLTLAAAVSGAVLVGGSADVSAGVRYHPGGGGSHMGGHGFGGMERRGFGHVAFGRGGRGFGEGDFGDGRVAAGLALGTFGAVASAAAEQQAAAQPQGGIANQPVLRPDGTYYYRRVQRSSAAARAATALQRRISGVSMSGGLRW